MASSAIEFEFKGNLAQLRRDLNEAARLAKQSSSDISRSTQGGFEGGFAGLFRRSPERRAELAFHQLAADISTGDVGAAVANFGSRLSGLGLAAGIGVGVAIGLFQKFSSEIKETSKSLETLSEHLAKPAGLQGALGPEGITKEIESFKKESDDLAEKQKSIGSTIASKFTSFSFGSYFGGKDYTAKTDPVAKAQLEDFNRLAYLTSRRADAELKIANLKLEAVTTSEKDASLAKITLEAEEKRAKLKLERPDDANLVKSLEAVNIEEKAARTAVEQKFKVKQDEAELERRILDLKTSGLSVEEQQTAETRLRIAALQSQLGAARPDERQSIQNRLTPLQNQITGLPWDQKTHSERMDAIRKSQADAARSNSVEEWRKRMDTAMHDYRQSRSDAMEEYNLRQYGEPRGLQLPDVPPGWGYNVNTGDMVMDQWGIKKTLSRLPPPPALNIPEGTGIQQGNDYLKDIRSGVQDLTKWLTQNLATA